MQLPALSGVHLYPAHSKLVKTVTRESGKSPGGWQFEGCGFMWVTTTPTERSVPHLDYAFGCAEMICRRVAVTGLAPGDRMSTGRFRLSISEKAHGPGLVSNRTFRIVTGITGTQCKQRFKVRQWNGD